MLPHEIEPFADAHVKNLQEVRIELINMYNNSPEDSILTKESLDLLLDKLIVSQRGFARFKACMVDEHKMKEKLHVKARHCRLHHKDQ